MACLVNDFASFDTTEDPGGASIVERKDFQTKRPLWLSASVASKRIELSLLLDMNLYTKNKLFQNVSEHSVLKVSYRKRTVCNE